MKHPLVLVALVACGGHEAAHPNNDEHHPCDPKGADVAQYQEPAIDKDLFPDELTLRGKCTEDTPSRDFTRNSFEAAQALEQQGTRHRSCNGVCEPFRAALPPLDEKHDLEDETFQRECTSAVGGLEEKVRGGCRHVCLVERRLQGSRTIFARTMRGLNAFEDKLPSAVLGDADVRRMWTEKTLALPPRRVRLATTIGADPSMTADGTLYPGGPALRLRLARGDAGCGLTQWSVDRW
jgi:hypothetical protein